MQNELGEVCERIRLHSQDFHTPSIELFAPPLPGIGDSELQLGKLLGQLSYSTRTLGALRQMSSLKYQGKELAHFVINFVWISLCV